MNTSSPGMSLAALLGGSPQSGPGAPESVSYSDFTGALAAAAAPQLLSSPQDGSLQALPEDMPSAAALAFLASLLGPAATSEEMPVEADAVAPQSAGGATRGSAAASRDLLTAAMLQDQGSAGARQGQIALPGADALDAGASAQGSDAGADLESLVATLTAARSGEQGARAPSDSATGLAGLLSAASHGASRVAAAEAQPQAAVRHPVGTAGWADEVGSRLVMMSLRGQHEGSLTLSPEHLGPLEVRISVSHDRTDVWFGAQQAETRAALADAMPRLRELFAASGLSLGEAGVSQDMPRQDARAADGASVAGASPAGSEAGNPVESVAVARAVHAALLDTWA